MEAKRQLKNLLKVAIGKFNFHRKDPKKKDIFIFYTRRSGSTWLMEIINSQKGIRWIADPLDVNRNVAFSQRHLLPDIPPSNRPRFIHLDDAEKEMLYQYFDKLLKGKIHTGASQWNILEGV